MKLNGAQMESKREAQMELKWSQGGSDTCVLNQGATTQFLCAVLGPKMDPQMAPLRDLSSLLERFFRTCFLDRFGAQLLMIWGSIFTHF